jgi:hypothetical protein
MSEDLAPILKGSIPAVRELEARLLERDIPVVLAEDDACCNRGGGCGCGVKVQLLVRRADLSRVKAFLDEDWLESLRREGVMGEEALVALRSAPGEAEDLSRCPACGCSAPRTEGACSDCGLQLE